MPSTVAESPFRRIHHFVEAQSRRSPDACALIHGEVQISYRELDDRAERLATHLRTLGVGPEVIVSICLERSVAAILSVLAVLKAGGAYLPLDPAYPSERLAYMLGKLSQSAPDHGARGLGESTNARADAFLASV